MKLPLDSHLLKDKSVVHPFANLISLGFDYGCLLILIAGAVAFDVWRVGQGLAWGWTAFVWIACSLLIGAIQHRIALMGHEASHFLLHPEPHGGPVPSATAGEKRN